MSDFNFLIKSMDAKLEEIFGLWFDIKKNGKVNTVDVLGIDTQTKQLLRKLQ